jgi:tRNA pseudouridine38-40 synthase
LNYQGLYTLFVSGGVIFRMIRNFKIVLEYDGTRYHGWQKQKNTNMTIQGILEALLKDMTGQEIEVHGAGRTDAGAHALGQTANFKLRTEEFLPEVLSEISREGENSPKGEDSQKKENSKNGEEKCGNINMTAWKHYMNKKLPKDIQILSVSEESKGFHSRLSAKEKTYCYRIRMSEQASVFSGRYETLISEPLDVEKMELAAEKFLGTHDFKAFSTNRQPKKNTERTVYSIQFQRTEKDLLEILFTGNGFLYNMIRIMTGTLIEIGMGKRNPEDIEQAFLSKDRKNAGYTAPAGGLTLVCVKYGNTDGE